MLVLRRDLADKPASLLLPKPPKNGSRILLERFTPLWKRLSFNYKVTMRNLFRYKSRAFMTIFGVAGCCGLLVMGFGIHDSLSGISNIEYSRIITCDLIAVKKEAFGEKAATNAQLITLKKGQSLAKYSKKLMKTGAVQGINQNASNKETIDNTMGSLNKVMIILIGMATILALVVIYNLSNINVEERIRELSTIKVLVFFDQETTL